MMCLGLFSLRTTSIVVVLATEAAIEGLLDKLLLLLLLGRLNALHCRHNEHATTT